VLSANLEATGNFDIRNLLHLVKVPTLVMHARGDATVPMTVGRELAAGIPGAKFVTFEGNNHVMLEQDSATQRFFEEIKMFIN
jgi:pimeloyl-ACP methyl ester carboxylesterase